MVLGIAVYKSVSEIQADITTKKDLADAFAKYIVEHWNEIVLMKENCEKNSTSTNIYLIVEKPSIESVS